MSLIIIAMLLFAPLPQQTTVQRSIQVIFVEPVGETFTEEEQQVALQNILESAQYWMDLSPITTTITIESTSFITASMDVFDNPSIVWRYATYLSNALPLVVIDNSDSHRFIYGSALGIGCDIGIDIVSSAGVDVYAHEFGHALYNLPHQYQDLYDIMGLVPNNAYQRHMIGCSSLAELGRLCTQVFVPIITNG